MPEDTRQVIVDVTIAAPIAEVWAALREPAQIANWFGWDAPSLAEEIQFIFVDGAEADEANHVIQFGEWEGASDAIELTEVNAGTRLRLMRTGGSPVDWVGTYNDVPEGWVTFFEQLRLALDLHRGQLRRTLYFSGASKPGIGEPLAELGLAGLGDLAAGAAYSAAISTGENLIGVVWYQTHFQTALTVEGWGQGLLAVTDMGVSPRRPHGGGSLVLTTYGLSDDAFAALQQRWQQWWDHRYTRPDA